MRYLEKSWWTFLIKSSSFVQSESKLIHFFESRFLDESKLIHSGVYVNLYVYPPWLSSLWTGTCFASIACGHPHAHFWGVPQTPSLLLCDDSDADDANDAESGIWYRDVLKTASRASSASLSSRKNCAGGLGDTPEMRLWISKRYASKTHLPQEGGDNQTGHPYKFVYAPEWISLDSSKILDTKKLISSDSFSQVLLLWFGISWIRYALWWR